MKKTVTYIIDILIILVILVVGIYGYKLLGNKAKGGNGGSSKVLLTVEFEKHENTLLEKIAIGDEIYDSSKNEFLGVIKNVTAVEPSVLNTFDYTQNKIVRAPTTEYGKKTVFLECNATVTENSVHVNNTEVRIGTVLGFRTNRYALSGKVMGIEVLE